jgi:hypothetical protein
MEPIRERVFYVNDPPQIFHPSPLLLNNLSPLYPLWLNQATLLGRFPSSSSFFGFVSVLSVCFLFTLPRSSFFSLFQACHVSSLAFSSTTARSSPLSLVEYFSA